MASSADDSPPTVLERPARPPADAEPDLADLPRGTTVGRYVVIDKVGQGGMGAVYSAYDHALHRRVALKLVTSRRDRIGQERLLAEARTMAQLSHPSIVAVYDVGELGSQVFLAMEFVEGATLRGWRADAERTWQEIIAIYAQAGEALAFAHDAGVIHRDFKPDNVLVDATERARVTDFGLAKVEVDPSDRPSPASSLITKHTISGTAAGTPGYMSPEQLTGEPTDARTDQFAFCVALFEALYGDLPGEVDKPEQISDAPREVLAALRRGLSDAPGDRWPSMRALLAAIVPRPEPRRWPIVAGAAIVLAGMAVALVVMRSTHAGCNVESPSWWNAERRAAIHRAFVATKAPHADAIATSFETTTEAWFAEWKLMSVQSCHATADGQQSDRVLELRTECLAHQLAITRSEVELSEHADRALVESVRRNVLSYRDLSVCADTQAMVSLAAAPDSPVIVMRIAAVEQVLANVQALSDTNHYMTALSMVKPLIAEAAVLDYPPLILETNLEYAMVEMGRAADPEAAATALWTAIAAQPGRTDWSAIVVWMNLAQVYNVMQHRPIDALNATHVADRLLRRARAPNWARPYLESQVGDALHSLGRNEEALDHLKRAVDGLEKAGDDYHLSLALADMSFVYASLHQLAPRIAALEHANQVAQRKADDIDGTKIMDYLVEAYTSAARYTDAVNIAHKAIAIIGDRKDEPTTLARLHLHLGRTLAIVKDYDTAEIEMQAALQIASTELEPHHVVLQKALYSLAQLELERHRQGAAVPYLEQAWQLTLELAPDVAASSEYVPIGMLAGLLGTVLANTGHVTDALLVFGVAAAMLQRIQQPADARIVFYSTWAPLLWHEGRHGPARLAMTMARDAALELTDDENARNTATEAEDWLVHHPE